MYKLKNALRALRKNIFYFLVKTKLVFGGRREIPKENILLEFTWPKIGVFCYFKENRDYKNKIDLSLIVPVYNSKRFIKKLVNCLANQKTKYKYEIIFVDDASMDGSFEILNKYVKRYSMMKILHQEKNGGISRARNAGLNIAKGKYIGFIDSDDFVSENYIDKMMNLAYTENADIVKCGNATIENEKIISKNKRLEEKINGKMNEKILKYPSYAWAAVYKSDLFRNIQFPDSYWYEDMIVRFLLYRRSKKFINIEDILYYRVSHDNQITKLMPSSGSAQCLEQLYLIEQLVDDNIRNGLDNDIYLYLNVLLECSNIMVSRIGIMSEDVKKQVFVRVYKLISGLYKEEYAKQLKGEWKLKSDIILKKRYDLWLMEKYL